MSTQRRDVGDGVQLARAARDAFAGPIATRTFRRWLWSGSKRSLAESVGFQRRAYSRAVLIIRAFYAVSVYWAISVAGSWPSYRDANNVRPMWPIRWWFTHVSIHTGVDIVFTAYLAAAFAVALLPQRRVVRIAYAIALVQYMALVNTPEKVNHDLHGWLFVSIVLIFLPRGPWHDRRRASDRQQLLIVFWIAMLVVLFFYSLTGLWKIYDGIFAAAHRQLSVFNVSGFSYIVGDRLLQTNQTTLLGDWLTSHPIPGWLMFLGTMYLEGASAIVAFRPRVHRVWGAALILFHLGTDLAMGFTFPENIVLIGLLLICSPFAPDHASAGEVVFDLPVVHLLARRFRALRSGLAKPPRTRGETPAADIEDAASTRERVDAEIQ